MHSKGRLMRPLLFVALNEQFARHSGGQVKGLERLLLSDS